MKKLFASLLFTYLSAQAVTFNDLQVNTNIVLSKVLATVTSYGAVGDNISNNSTALQLALNTGNPLFIPAGTFAIGSKLSIPDNARIYGVGDASVIRTTVGSISAFEIAGKTNVLIQGISFLGASNNSAASSAAGNAIYITNSSSIRINDVNARYFNTGIYITGNSRTVRIDGKPIFTGNARAGVNTDTASDVIVSSAVISGNRTGVGDGARGMVGVWFQAGGRNNIAEKCTISTLANEGINLKSVTHWAYVNYVEDADNGIIFETDGSDMVASNNGSYGGAIGNILTNIAGVGIYGGNTIGVNNAVVHHLNISANIISSAEFGLAFAGLNSSATNERPYALNVVGNQVTGTTVGAGMLINADNSLFEANIIRGAFTDGIQLYRGTNNTLIGNQVYGPKQNGIYLFTGGYANAVKGNFLVGGSASAANTYDGLRIANQTNAIISDNVVIGSDWRYLMSDESTSVGTVWRDNDPIGSYGTSLFNFAGSSGKRFNNYSGILSVEDVNQRVGIGTQSPGTTWGGNRAAVDYWARYMLVGSDLSADFTRTDDTAKRWGIAVVPYDLTPGVQVTAFQWDMGSANNVQSYGGGTSANYAMTRHSFFAAANTATATGTEVMRLTTTGVSIGYAADPGVALDVNGSIRIASGSNYQSKDSGGSTKTLLTYSDSSGVILGNGSDAVQLQPGTSGVNLTAVGTTSPVTVKRLASATSGATLKDSNQLKFETSYWDGAGNIEVFSRIVGVADSTNGPIYSLVFKDNAGSNTMAITNNGNVTVAGQFKAIGGITNTTISGNTISAGSATLGLGSSTVTFAENFVLDGTAAGQGIRFNGSAWGASSLFAMTDTANAWGDGVTQTFNPNGTSAGINVGSISGNPSSPNNGDLWYDIAGGHALKARINGATVSLGSSGIGGSTGSTDNRILRADGTGGATLQNSVINLTDETLYSSQYYAQMAAAGAQTDNHLVISPKGTGAFIVGPAPDGSTTGGNNRGTYAVDIQPWKDFAGCVASADRSVAIGARNTSSAAYSVAIGYNDWAAAQGAIAIGESTTASGVASVALGVNTGAAGAYSMAQGFFTQSPNRGQISFSGGNHGAVSGSSQSSIFTVYRTTTATTQVTLATDGSSGTLALQNNSAWTFEAKVTGITSGAAAVYSYTLVGIITRGANAASTAMPVAVTKTVIYESNAAADCDAVADTSGGALAIKVTPFDSTNTKWSATVVVNQVIN